MDIGKIPPHDIEAEQAVLGSMLTDKDAVIAAIEVLKEDSFYREDNKLIFSAITNLYSRNEPIDLITVLSKNCPDKYWKSVALENDAKVIDIQEIFNEVQRTVEPKKLAIDGIHPTDLGHTVIADAIEKVFEFK